MDVDRQRFRIPGGIGGQAWGLVESACLLSQGVLRCWDVHPLPLKTQHLASPWSARRLLDGSWAPSVVIMAKTERYPS